MSVEKNTFEDASQIYLDLSKPTGPSGNRLVTTAEEFVIGYQGEEYTGYTSRGFEFRASDPNLAYLDIHANDGATAANFDYRMIWGAAGATGESQGLLNLQGGQTNFFMPIRTVPAGAAIPPLWFLDYGTTTMTDGLNQATTITFNTTFKSAPTLQCTLLDLNGPGSGNQADLTIYVESITTTGASVRGLGNCGTDIAVMWVAMGGP